MFRDSGAGTDKGALYHEFDPVVHEFVTHVRRLHHPLDMDVNGASVQVKACNPLVPATTTAKQHCTMTSFPVAGTSVW